MASISDNGCDLHSDCFTCPFSLCRHELEPGQLIHEKKVIEANRTKARVREFLAAGLIQTKAVKMVAAEIGYSSRTIFRHLSMPD